MKPQARLLMLAAALWSAPLFAQDMADAAPAPAAEAAPVGASTGPLVMPSVSLGDPEYMLALDLSTGGRVVIQLFPHIAPGHVERIKTLARQGFYDGVVFHRVIDGFMAQTGDPTGTGQGGSPLPDLKAEFNAIPHLRGTVSMARAADNDSANSQFFIMFLPRFSLDRKYTAFGRVVEGMEHVDAVERGEPPVAPSRIVRASVLADNKPPPAPPPALGSLPAAAPAPGGPAITLDQLNAPQN